MEIERLDLDGVVYYSYCAPCPVCRIRDITPPDYEWRHTSCGGRIMIGDNARFLCEKCDSNHPVMSTIWKCPCCAPTETAHLHAGITDWGPTSIFGRSIIEVAGKEWLIRFMQNL